MADHFDVVSVRPDDKSCIVFPAVVRAQAGRAIVLAARCQRCAMKSLDLLAMLGDERQVKVRGRLVGLEQAQRSLAVRAELDAKRPFRNHGHADRSPFNYLDTASSRAEINAATAKLIEDAVAIVGLGGTGSYVLDMVAKTPVKQIHLFDDDRFLTHNAFRAPGAPAIEELRKQPLKVEYLKAIYSRMHRGIVEHPVAVNADNADELRVMSFVFLCMEGGAAKRAVIGKLEELGIPFADVGMGLYEKRDSIGGMLRTVLSLLDARDAARARISFAADDAENEYDKNIQIADLNALNACFAVIAWKKLRGFYFNLGKKRFSSYTIGNSLLAKGDLV